MYLTYKVNNLIISSDISNSPEIHFWNCESLETIKILKVDGHSNGILFMTFSKNGKYLVSVSSDEFYSLNIYLPELDHNSIIKNTSIYPVFGVKFLYSHEDYFIQYGYRHIIIWRIVGNTLEK